MGISEAKNYFKHRPLANLEGLNNDFQQNWLKSGRFYLIVRLFFPKGFVIIRLPNHVHTQNSAQRIEICSFLHSDNFQNLKNKYQCKLKSLKRGKKNMCF